MAGFHIAPHLGLSIVEWSDPPLGQDVGRQGSVAISPHRRYRRLAGFDRVEVRALVNGDGSFRSDQNLPAPDGGLDPAPFIWWWAEAPDGGPSIFTEPGASASAIMDPIAVGHYVLAARRRSWGAVFFHFDVDPS